MNTHKVTQIFVGGGAALDANNIEMGAITKQTAIVGSDMTTLNPAGGDTISTQPSIYIVNKLANGDLKKSMEIKGTNVTGYNAESYTPAKKEVWAIGYDRKLATGSITVSNDTLYSFYIRFKWDKQFFSERPETLSVTFKSSASATQSNIATQIVNAINNSGYGSSPSGIKVVKAVKVGNGTGVYGLTAATSFGVEIWGLDVNQFQNTSYKENIVYFSVHVDGSTGFDTSTTCTQIQAFDYGTGTYNQVYNMENFNYQYEGVLNRTKFPIPTLTYLSSSTGVTSDTLVAFTVTGTVSEDKVTFSAAASTQLPVGSKVVLGGVNYEIKYYISTTVAVLTEVLSAGLAAETVAGKAWYDVINIEFTDVVTSPGANVGSFAKKVVVITTPAIDSTDTAMTGTSAEGANLKTVLDAWMATTPLSPVAITI